MPIARRIRAVQLAKRLAVYDRLQRVRHHMDLDVIARHLDTHVVGRCRGWDGDGQRDLVPPASLRHLVGMHRRVLGVKDGLLLTLRAPSRALNPPPLVLALLELPRSLGGVDRRHEWCLVVCLRHHHHVPGGSDNAVLSAELSLLLHHLLQLPGRELEHLAALSPAAGLLILLLLSALLLGRFQDVLDDVELLEGLANRQRQIPPYEVAHQLGRRGNEPVLHRSAIVEQRPAIVDSLLGLRHRLLC
mmetsp:Transcript_39573/g.79080  ORF Transcript_39573/g.79080 Transcript_39573/m.79080 type:complete len:246 (-) Transcript_39573:129-866(-)